MSIRYASTVPTTSPFASEKLLSGTGGIEGWFEGGSNDLANSGSRSRGGTWNIPTALIQTNSDFGNQNETSKATASEENKAFWAAGWGPEWVQTDQPKPKTSKKTGLIPQPGETTKKKSNLSRNKKKRNVDIEQQLGQQSRYKTELCRSWSETGACRYGAKCQFAHGRDELRPILRHPKYKTEICKTFHTLGTCPYGTRCRFIHDPDERRDTPEVETPETASKAVTPVPTKAPTEKQSKVARSRSKSQSKSGKKKKRLPIFKLLSKGPREEK